MIMIAFYKGKTHLFNRLVAWWTNGPYSHVEVVLGMDNRGNYHCLSSSLTDGGVRIKTMPLPSSKWDILTVKGEVRDAEDWAAKHLGAKYDTPGLFGFVWRRNIRKDHKWFCSEVVADILKLDQPSRYDPNALYSVLHSPWAAL